MPSDSDFFPSLFIVVALGMGILVATIVHTQRGGSLLTVCDRPEPAALRLHVRHRFDASRHAVLHDDPADALLPGDRERNHDEGPELPATRVPIAAMTTLGAIIFIASWLRFRKIFG